MKHIRLVGFEDEPTGNLGLIVKGMAGDNIYSDGTGSLIAHDIVEHQNGLARIGCPADEIEALGGMWFTRGRHGSLFEKRQTFSRNVVEAVGLGDFGLIGRDWWWSDKRWYPRFGQYRTRAHDYDDDFRDILEAAKFGIKSEMDCEGVTDFPMEEFLENSLHLLRIGFNKARRRWGDGMLATDTYCAIRDAIEPHAKRVEFEGQEFLLSYGGGRARCVEFFPDDHW